MSAVKNAAHSYFVINKFDNRKSSFARFMQEIKNARETNTGSEKLSAANLMERATANFPKDEAGEFILPAKFKDKVVPMPLSDSPTYEEDLAARRIDLEMLKINILIIEEAEKHNVLISEDPQLLALLSRLNVDEEIPQELYTLVAVVLSWVYWLKDMRPGDEKAEP